MAGLLLKQISKRFDDALVLDDITLELNEGELLVLLGASGCGKSTLLRIVAGLEEADGGEVYIDSHRVDNLPPRRRNVAMVFQNYSLYPHMSVEKNLAFPLRVARLPRREIAERVRTTAEMIGLADRLSARPGQLSGGQRQRVALGRAVIRDPSVFLLDEPLSNLDADLRVRMRQEIVALQKRVGRAMIHVTHDQAEALSMADRIALLHNGRLEQIGTPEELYRRPASRYVAEFIGSPKINMITGRIIEGRLVPFGISAESLPIQPTESPLTIGIRPEAMHLSGTGQYTAVVQQCEYLGDHYVARVRFNDIDLTISKLPHDMKTGSTVNFSIEPKDLLFFDSDNGMLVNQ